MPPGPRRRWSTSRTTLRGSGRHLCLRLPGPQRSDRTVRHSAGDAPLLVVPALRSDEGVDGTTLRFLLEQNLSLKKKPEEEEKERKRLERRQVLLEEFFALVDVPVRRRSPQQVSRLEALVEALDGRLGRTFLPAE